MENVKYLRSTSILLREEDSNLRPSGYEPEKLPLLYPAMFVQKTGLEPANPSEWQSDMRPLTPLLHMKDE